MNDTTGDRNPDAHSPGPASRVELNDTAAEATSDIAEPTGHPSGLFRGEAIATDLSEIDLLPLTVFTDDGAEDTASDTTRRSSLGTYQRARTAGGVDIGDGWWGLEPVVIGSNPAHTAAV